MSNQISVLDRAWFGRAAVIVPYYYIGQKEKRSIELIDIAGCFYRV